MNTKEYMNMSRTLLDQWRDIAYDEQADRGQLPSGTACKLHGQRMLCRVEDVAVFLILRKQCVIVSI